MPRRKLTLKVTLALTQTLTLTEGGQFSLGKIIRIPSAVVGFQRNMSSIINVNIETKDFINFSYQKREYKCRNYIVKHF